MLLADREEQAAEIDETSEAATTESKDHIKPVRAPLPEVLPRTIIEHPPPRDANAGCPACGGKLHPLGRNETEILDYVPGGGHSVGCQINNTKPEQK